MNLRVFESVSDLASSVGAYLVRKLERQPQATIALSGGSTPKLLYEILGTGMARDEISRSMVTWVLGDERCVPPEDDLSNSRMVSETLFREGIPEGHRFLRFKTELGEPRMIADEYDREWKLLGLRDIDIAFLGVGDDGHTASLFPGTEAIEVEEGVSVAVYVPRLDAWRVTLTLPVIRAAHAKIILAAGKGKRDVIERVRRGENLPIVLAGGAGDDAWWFIDQEANPGG